MPPLFKVHKRQNSSMVLQVGTELTFVGEEEKGKGQERGSRD